MWVMVASGPDTGRTMPITDGALTIGRTEESTLVLHDGKVSRRHAALEPHPSGWTLLRDLGSANGTYVNGYRVQETAWLRGDEHIVLGDTDLALLRYDPAVTQAAP